MYVIINEAITMQMGNGCGAVAYEGRTMRKNKTKILSAIAALLMVLVFAAPSTVLAAEPEREGDTARVPERVTEYFNVNIDVHENNSYDYTETVGTVFNTPGHGIYRNVPEEWDGISEDVGKGWCSSDPVETGSEGGFYVLQIGSGEKTISGKHEFKYGYKITMRDDRETDYDLLYIDLLPTDWQTPIEKSEITVKLPKKIDEDAITIYGGTYGSEGIQENVSWKYDGEKTISISGENLEKGEGITLKVDLPEGYWVGQKDPKGTRPASAVLMLLVLAVFGAGWFLYGRRQHVVETVEFHPPKGVTPAEIGLIIDGSMDKKDMMSMFMYFAQKGYLKIKEKKKHFRFIKVKDIDKGEKRFAAVLFNGIFSGGDNVSGKNMGTEFGQQYDSACAILEDMVGSVMPEKSKWVQRIGGMMLYVMPVVLGIMAAIYSLRDGWLGFTGAILGVAAAFIAGKLRKSYRNRNSGKKSGRRFVRCLYWIIDALLLAGAAAQWGECFESGAIGVLLFIAPAGCHILNVYFDRLSEHSLELMGKILGLKNFIRTAELEKLNQLVEEDPEYFFNILPYAYVMGLTDKWAKKFENIRIERPDWFMTDSDAGYIPAIYMGSAMNNLSRELGSSISEAISSGSDDGGGFSGGGSSGGGFSGGGAGGGGGGFW